MILGACGFIGSGKGTFGEYLVKNHNWKSLSFAESLKDITAILFHWPRDLLEGDTEESRNWREIKDAWWSKKLGKDITPRWVLQHIGTDVMRNHFADDIWILNIERKIKDLNNNAIITDVRFPNEIKMIRSLKKGKTVWIRKLQLPEWYDVAHAANSDTFLHAPEAHDMMLNDYKIHYSEWAWIGEEMDYTIFNDGTRDEFYQKIDKLITDIGS